MPLPLGVLAVGVSSAPPSFTSDYEFLETISVGTAVASIEFTNIEQTYKHLQIRTTHRLTNNATSDTLRMRINGATTGYQSVAELFGTGTSASTDKDDITSSIIVGISANANYTTNQFGASIIDFHDYTNTNKFKTAQIFHSTGYSAQTDRILTGQGYLASGSAVTSISFFPGTGNLAVGSRFSLYGIKG